jgi:hypothetical protein
MEHAKTSKRNLDVMTDGEYKDTKRKILRLQAQVAAYRQEMQPYGDDGDRRLEVELFIDYGTPEQVVIDLTGTNEE